MKLNPQQAPLYGECVLTVQLNDEECVEDEEVEFYLLFAGTTQRHLTTTLRVSHVTLQAVCPAHNRGETVQVTLCQARPGGLVDTVGEDRFQFVQDLALDMAQFLLSASGQRDGLEGALLLDECQIPLQECERLDETLALALRHIPLPPGWSVLGTDINTHSNTDPGPHETLLHFAARRGLRRVALFLLQQPGGRDALRHPNKQGHTPAGVAHKRGHSQLQHLLSELEESPRFETKAARPRFPGGRGFLHHPKLNTFTLTVDSNTDTSPPDLRTDVEELQRFIKSHRQEKGLSLIEEQQPVSLILSNDIFDGSQKAARTSCPGPSLQNLPVCEHQEAEAVAERENGELLNGTGDYTQLEQLEKVVELESSAGEGVCVEGRVQSGDISGTSRGELQQEEADREVCVITAEQKEHFSNTTHNKPQSGNSEEAAMGQSQGLLPSETKHGSEKSEESRRRDLPKEKEGEASSGQETADLSTLQQGVLEEGGQKHSEKQADGCCVETQASSEHLGANQGPINQGPLNVNAENSFDGVLKDDNQNSSKVRTEGSPEENPIHFSPGFVEHSEVIASKTGNEIVGCSENRNDSAGSPEEDTGNHCATIEADKGKGFNVLETDSALDSISLRPNMAPGPVHKVQRESSPLPDCRKPEETVVEVTENPGDPAEQDQQINQMTVSPAATASASVRELPDEAGSSDDVADGVNDEADGFMESVAAVSSPAEEDNGEVASIQVTPGGAPSLGVSEDGAGEKREDIRSSLVVAGAQEKSSQMSEDASSSDQATVGKTQTHRKEDAPSSDVAALEEKSPDAEVEEASQRSEDPSPSELTAVEETLSGEGEAVSSSVEAAIGETLPEAANGEPSQRHEALSPCDETANEEAFSSGSENVSPAASSSEGDTSSQQSEDAFDSAEATVGETLLGESGDSSLSDLTALMEKLSVVSKDASPSDETGCGETSPQRCEDGSPSSLTAEIEETSADTGVGETLFQKSEAESPSEESGVTGTVTESVETPPSDLTTAEKALSEENTEFNESQPETGVITDTPELTQGLEGSQSPQNEALSVDQTHEVPTQASKPEEVPCNPFEASEATCVVSGNSKKTIPHNQPEESNKEMDPAACEIPLPSTLTSTSTCDSMPKENSAEIITLDQQSEVVTSGAESHVPQALEQTVKAIHPSSDTHTKSEGSNETREECVSSNIASHEGDSPSTSPCDSCVSKEGNIQGISLDPQSETSRTEGLVPDAPLPVSIATDIEYTSADSICGCSLDNTSTSDTLGASTLPLEKTLPLDKDNGTALGLDTGSPVEVDSGLSHDLPPSDTDSSPGGLCGSNSLNEERNQTEGECRGKEEPHEEQVADNHNGSAEDGQTSLTDMDQAAIHRETEVFYPLESCSDDQEQKEPPSAENSSTGCSVEAVCRSVSASSVVESESISDGDSLLSVETTDDSVFKQSEDAVTRTADSTSGVSVTGSSSTDDSSSLEPCGSEPQSEEGNEGTLTPCSDQPIGGVLTLSSDQPVEDTLTPVSDHPAEGALTPVSDHPAEGALTPVSDHPDEGALTPVSDHPAEGALTPVSDHPDEGALTPVCDQPVGDALIPGSEQPAEGAPQTAGETEEEERKDRLSEVPERSAILRSSVRSLSPSRRHSWGPSKNSAGEAETQVQRSMSWCPSDVPRPETDEMNARSYSLEGLAEGDVGKCSALRQAEPQHDSSRPGRLDSEERGSLVSLTEEEQESDMGDASSLDSQQSVQGGRRCAPPPPLALTKSVSMSAISPRDLDVIGRTRPKRRISFSFSISPILPKSKTLFAIGSSSSEDEEAANLNSFTRTAESLENSISEEDPGPLRSDSSEARVGGTKVSRTFSYLKSKMSKKSKEKDREKNKDGKEKEKRSSSGHLFSSVSTVPPSPCLQCSKTINTKDALQCANCSAHIHKGCREGLPVCAKVKMKQQQTVPDSASGPGVPLRSKPVTVRERPWSTIMAPDDQMPPPPIPPPRKSPGIMAFNTSPLSKSISISNIAGQTDDAPLKGLKFLSQSTDSLHKVSKVNESTESLTDEGAELMEGQLMWDFESDAKELEADSWSSTMDKKYLKQLKKDVVKRQDVIYELIQTEMHHVRTLHIMADVYSKGLQKEMQLETQTLEKMFPVMEELLDVHTDFFTHLLERKRAEQAEKDVQGGYIIRRIGDVLLEQVTGFNADRMTKVYGKFCSRHNEAVNLYKELHAKDKRFQAFIKKTMSSSIVRRLSIPECILLVTQRITKYPVLLQRILQHTKEPEEEQGDTAEALQQVKEVIAAVDLKVSEYEMRQRLKEIHSRTDSKSIMRMKSGQMFAKEDLIRGRRLVHDGPLQLKNTAGRLKDVQALLLSDVFVFLQEKDQKYVFASLDQRSTVISLRKLIVREVANEERGLFLITAGMEKPEMVEVYSSSKVERNTWIQLIQNTMQSIEKEDDEGIPSENEEDKRLQEVKAKEMRDQLQKKDDQIVGLLEDKVRLFRELCECSPAEDATLRSRMMFRATPDEVTKGEPIISHALKEVEKLQELVNGSVCGAVGQQVCAGQESVCVSSVSLPRRAETFGGFDSHQMNSSKTKDGEKEEADESVDLRRTESDSVLKKGGNANLLLLLKRNSEQVLQSVTRLHDLLNTLQAVVVQQDTFIEDQRQALNDRSSRHPSVSSSSSSSSSSRPASLIEQEKQRSAERLRQEAEERRRRQKEWEQKEKEVQQREERLNALEEENTKRRRELDEEKNELQNKKEEYQRDLARLRDSQRRLEREREQLYTQSQLRQNVEDHLQPRQRTSSTASEDSLKLQSTTEPAEGVELSSSPSTHDLLSRLDSKRKSKNLNLFSSGSGQKGGATAEPQSQMPSRLLQLAKPKEKKEKKKKKGKGQQNQPTDAQGAAEPGSSAVFFC